MTSGQQALRRIDAALSDLRQDVADLTSASAHDAKVLAELEAEEIELYTAMASVRMDHLSEDEPSGGALRRADQAVYRLIEEHQSSIDQLNSDRTSLEDGLTSLESRRRDLEDAHRTAISAHDAAAVKTRERIEQEDAYQSLATVLEEANAKLRRSVQKLETAQATEREKGSPYRADPLFRYLFDRGFGTKAYKAFPLFAMLDRWVASLINYKEHKLNYDRLLELPKFLEAHVARLEEEADAADEQLEAYERDALTEDGVDNLKATVESFGADLDSLDTEIDQTEARLNELGTKIEEASLGNTDQLKEARRLMSKAIAGRGLNELYRLASETTSLEDEELVDSLAEIAEQKAELEEAQREAQRTIKRERTALSSLEDVRRRFKRSRFDSPYSEFSGKRVIRSLLKDFLQGEITGDQLWRQFERRHRTQRRDWDNGMGGHKWKDGFGLPKEWGRGGSVDWADVLMEGASRLPRRRRGGMRIPRAPRPRRQSPSRRRRSSGRGGFKTGGGF